MRVESLVQMLGGVAARRTLLAAAASRGEVDAACRRGALVRVARGVFALPDVQRESTWARCNVALAYLGPPAALTHQTAAAMMGLRDMRPGEDVHIMVPHGTSAHRRMRGVVVHQTIRYAAQPQAGMDCASLRQVLIHLAAERDPNSLRFPALAAFQKGLVAPAELRDPDGVPRHHLGTWTAVAEEAAAGAESGGVGAYWRLLKDSPLPLPELNVPLPTPGGRYRLDAWWRRFDLVAEIDGRKHQTREQDFERDRVRQNHIHASGLVVVRFTVHQVLTQPTEVLAITGQNLTTRAAAMRG